MKFLSKMLWKIYLKHTFDCLAVGGCCEDCLYSKRTKTCYCCDNKKLLKAGILKVGIAIHIKNGDKYE